MKWPPPRLLPDVVEVTRSTRSEGDTPFRFHDRTPIYIDGSGMYGKYIEVRTAASAAVQKTDDDWDCISWPVPDEIDQTSVVSEILALLMALRHMEKGLKYVVYADCMAVILGFAKSFRDLRGRGRHDGLRKQIYEAREGLDVVVLKTKAHRSREQAVIENDIVNFEGNEAADHEANRSANNHGHRRLLAKMPSSGKMPSERGSLGPSAPSNSPQSTYLRSLGASAGPPGPSLRVAIGKVLGGS